MSHHPANDTTGRRSHDPGGLRTMDPPDDASSSRSAWLVPAALFLAIAVTMTCDLLLDRRDGVPTEHLVVEFGVLLLAAVGLGWLGRRLWEGQRAARRLAQDLAVARLDASRWRAETQELVAGLGAAIDRQFTEWGFSPAEREIGLLLLKGLALRDIAQVRGTSERTVRQQALSVYKKAQVGGRAELSAFFLEDLLLPSQQGTAPPAPKS
jgi:DNA-binding CsgD family transcriptional regulator